MGMMHTCYTDEEKRASCHVEADILVNQARSDCAGSEHDVFALIKWRLGELLNDLEVSSNVFHTDVIEAKMRELAASQATG